MGNGAESGKTNGAKDPGLLDSVVQAMRHIVDLRVVTTVCDVTVKKLYTDLEVTLDEDDQKSAVTSINLIEGDIKNALHKDYMSADDPMLRDFHQAQVKLAQEIVANNVETLAKIVNLLWDKIKDREDVKNP